jgi:hypothetical protein
MSPDLQTWLSGFFIGLGAGWIWGRTSMRKWMLEQIKKLDEDLKRMEK